MPTVEIPEVGTVEFPDDMSVLEIERAIKQDILKTEPKGGTFLQRARQVLTEEVVGGGKTIAEGAAPLQPGEGLGGFLMRRLVGPGLGALRLLSAPVTAMARPTAERTVEATGLPRAFEFPLEIAASIPLSLGMGTGIRLGSRAMGRMVGRGAGPAAPAEPITAAAREGAEAIPPAGAVRGPGLAEIPAAPHPATTVGLNTAEVNKIADQALPFLKTLPDEDRRIFLRVADLVSTGEVDQEFFKHTISQGGRILQVMSRVKQALTETADPDLARALGLLEKEAAPTAFDQLNQVVQKMDRVRRGLLVTQFATAARNAISQAQRYTLDVADQALQLALQGKPSRALGESVEHLWSVMRAVSPDQRKILIDALDAAPDEAMRLLSRSSLIEAGVPNQVVAFFNGLNRVQERFFQTLAFDSKLRSELTRRGLDLNTLAPKDIPVSAIRAAVDHALELTFAKTAQSEAGRSFVTFMSKFPMTTVNPFPRFNFANAMPFLFEFSPAGAMKLFTPKAMEQMASGNPELAAKAISRATLGTLMLGTGLAIRQSPAAGEKWWEIALPNGKMLDTRAFAPFSTYLFLAEGLLDAKRPAAERRLRPSDIAQGLIGLNRVAGTGLVLTDILRGKTTEQVGELFNQFAGQVIGGFTVPARTAQELIGAVNPQENIIRDVSLNPLLGPLLRNLPGASQTLPEARSPLKAGPLRSESPVLRQLTGLSMREKTAAERFIDRLNLPYESSMPRTGVPEANLAIKREMGPITEVVLPLLERDAGFRRLPPAGQRLVARRVLSEIKKEAMVRIDPDLLKQVIGKGLDRDLSDLVESRGVIIPGRR